MTVNSTKKAWEMVNEAFPTDYQKDDRASEKAGYDVYRSTAEDHYYDYVCDLGSRLEINLSTGETINIRIEEEPTVDANVPTSVKSDTSEESHIEVIVSARETGEEKHFADFSEFIKEWRFYHSGGKVCNYADGDEAKFYKMRDILIKENGHGDSLRTSRSGLNVELIYYRWREYDRYMKRKEAEQNGN